MPSSIITATGSYIPALKIPNEYFLSHDFYGADGKKLDKSNLDLIKKLAGLTDGERVEHEKTSNQTHSLY